MTAAFGTGGSTEGLRAELAGLYAAGDAIEARITGLKRRLAESDTQLERSHATLAVARAEWNRQQIAAFEERYLKVVDEFRAITRQAMALGMALGEDALQIAACGNCAFGLMGGASILEETRYAPYAAADSSPNWEADAKAKAFFEANRGPRLIDQELSKLIAETRSRPARDAWKAKEQAAREKAERVISDYRLRENQDTRRIA